MPLSEEQLFGQAAAAKKKREDDVGFFTSALVTSLDSSITCCLYSTEAL